jgi:hypothetical protein
VATAAYAIRVAETIDRQKNRQIRATDTTCFATQDSYSSL